MAKENMWVYGAVVVLLAIVGAGFNSCKRAVETENKPVDFSSEHHSSVKDSTFHDINETVKQVLRTEMVDDTNLLIRQNHWTASFLSEGRYMKIADKWFVFSGFADSNPGDTPYEMVILNLKNRQASFIAFDSLRDFSWVTCGEQDLLVVDYGHCGNFGNYGLDSNFYKKLIVLNENNRFSKVDICTKATQRDYQNIDNDIELDCSIAVNESGTIHVSATYENNSMVKQAEGCLAIQHGRLIVLKKLPKWNHVEVIDCDTAKLVTFSFPDK